ncbi:SDR family NAD(P)-dependent oxidoreductase [Nocardioides sp. W7]|uniref:SDR family NAD(P)-dependent oxidoreductase n=1 Tax=Nocardioides sp. W7 TaxID=2931390 RepID=UPI001FD3240A|nr:SDR family NAD(P)-dependent oxidoreductase [Nocardioides sp. W7]
MDLQLSSKTAFVSGSTQGIGYVIAEALLGEGASVIINGRTVDRVEAAVDEHPEAHSCCCPEHVSESVRKVTKGGSHVCAPTYCHRYRPAARQGHGVRSSTNHLGFRCVRDA